VHTIQGGEALLEARPGERLVVVDARIGERLVTPRTPSLRLGNETEISIVGDLPTQGLVRVVDALSGADLPRVQVVPWTCSDQTTALPPLTALLSGCSRSCAAPLTLPANPRHLAYWLGASGYAWRRIEFGTSSGNPVYALEAAGGLRVDLRGRPGGATHFALQLEREIENSQRVEELAEEPLQAGEPLVLAGLPVGTLIARVLASGSGLESVVLERRIQVAVGATTELGLDLDSLWQPSNQGEIQLALILEDDSDANALEVRCESLDTSMPCDSAVPLADLKRRSDDSLRWHLAARPAGRYRISVPPSSVTTEVQVEPRSVAQTTLSVPALPKLRLWALDRTTSSSVPVQAVVWRPAGNASHADWSFTSPQVADGAIDFPLAAGRIELAVQAAGYLTAKLEIEVQPGWNEELIELQPLDPREILVRLTSDGNAVPAPEETWSATTATAASGRSALVGLRLRTGALMDGCCSDGASSILLVDGPGTYRVTLGPVPGFQSPESISVVVGADRATVEFELVPARSLAR